MQVKSLTACSMRVVMQCVMQVRVRDAVCVCDAAAGA